MHRASRVRAFGRPPPAHPVASRRREARAPPRGRAPCRHNSIPQQSPSCVSVSGFAAVGVRNPTGDRANFQSEFACASSVAFSLGTQRSPRRGRVKSSLCVVFDLHATVTTKTPFLARVWLSERHHAFPRYPAEREKAGTIHRRVPTLPRCRWRALGDKIVYFFNKNDAIFAILGV